VPKAPWVVGGNVASALCGKVTQTGEGGRAPRDNHDEGRDDPRNRRRL